MSSGGIEDVPPEQLERVLRTNVFGYVFMAKAAVRSFGGGVLAGCVGAGGGCRVCVNAAERPAGQNVS